MGDALMDGPLVVTREEVPATDRLAASAVALPIVQRRVEVGDGVLLGTLGSGLTNVEVVNRVPGTEEAAFEGASPARNIDDSVDLDGLPDDPTPADDGEAFLFDAFPRHHPHAAAISKSCQPDSPSVQPICDRPRASTFGSRTCFLPRVI